MARTKSKQTKNVTKDKDKTSKQQQEPQPGPSRVKQPKKSMAKHSVVCHIGNKTFKLSYPMLKEIRRLQKSTQPCIPKAPFARVIREVLQHHGEQSDKRLTVDAILALHEATEMFLVGLMEDSNVCAAHAKRITVRPDDMNLVLNLRR